jgi:hypothetical protein
MKAHAETQAELTLLGPGMEGVRAPQPSSPQRRHSAFDAIGFRESIAQLQEEIRTLYTADEVPWIVGYSAMPLSLCQLTDNTLEYAKFIN